MRKPCPKDLFLMLNGTTSSLTCPLPRGTWATENPWLARDPRCHHLLRPKKWLPVASTPSRLSSMAHYCLSLLQKMAHREGTWERINQAIGERLRVRLKRNPQPSAGIVDSQGRSRVQEWAEKNVVTMEVRRSRALKAPHPGGHRGFRTQGKGPQRQGDGLGRDQDATLQQADTQFPRLKHLWVDAGYRGEDKGKSWVEKKLGWSVDLAERPKKPAPKEVLVAWA